MHHPCLDKTIPGHETVQTMEINIMQRKYKENTIQKGSLTDLKTRWTIHGNSRSTGKTGHEPQD